MAKHVCAEYAPFYCENCKMHDLCTERIRKRNRTLVQQACRFTTLLQHCYMAHNNGTATDAKYWSEIYNNFFGSRVILSKDSFCKDVDSNTSKDSKAFADRLKALYSLFDDLILLRVDRARVVQMGAER